MLTLTTMSSGRRNLFLRIKKILAHFGITNKKFGMMLDQYSSVTQALECLHSFPVTAVILKRLPKLIRELCQRGIEFAVRGYIHTDYSMLPLNEQVEHLMKAIDIFTSYYIPFVSFRAVFLRVNDQTPHALGCLGFAYDSSYIPC